MIAVRIVECAADPAFATSTTGHITAWNPAMAEVSGRPACEVLGRPCYEVLAGRDVFGNRYCSRACPPLQMIADSDPISHFEIRFDRASGDAVSSGVSVLVVAGSDGDEPQLVHLLSPIRHDRRARHEPAEPAASSPGTRASTASAPFWRIPLTKRQLQVLALISQGRTTATIADELGISAATVRNHAQTILERLDASSRLEAVAIARHQGWLPD